MTAQIGQQKEATQRLQAKYEGEPKPIISSASIGGEQMTIDIGMKHVSQLVVRKSNNAAMEMAIADFFTVRMYMTGLLSLVVLDK